jgi:Response regulator receiver domain
VSNEKWQGGCLIIRMGAVDPVPSAGYEALEACDADEAIRILESRDDVDLVFTDVQMPGTMDGIKLSHYIRDRWPPLELIARLVLQISKRAACQWVAGSSRSLTIMGRLPTSWPVSFYTIYKLVLPVEARDSRGRPLSKCHQVCRLRRRNAKNRQTICGSSTLRKGTC